MSKNALTSITCKILWRVSDIKALLLSLAVACALSAQAANETLVWKGGSSGTANNVEMWDPNVGLTPYTSGNSCNFVITNSVAFTVASATGDYWRNARTTVTNGAQVSFGGRFWPSSSSESVIDVAAGAKFNASYMTGGDTGHVKAFIKEGKGDFVTPSIGTSGHFKYARLRAGTTATSALKVTDEIEVCAGSVLKCTALDIVNTNDGATALHPVVIVDGVFDCGGTDGKSKAQRLECLRGSGVVANASAGVTLTLVTQGTGVFSGSISGKLTVAPFAGVGADSCFVVGSAYTLTNAELYVSATAACPEPIKFAPGIGTFYVKKFPVDCTFYDTDGNPVTLELWANHLYVDCSVASSGDGLSRVAAYKTIKEALESPNLSSEMQNIVHVAAGVYDSGEMGDSLNLSRAVVPANVWLVSDEGAERTFIVGAPSTASHPDDWLGCGEGAVRCVSLDGGARVQGFTLTGGRTYAVDKSSVGAGRAGGGVYCSDRAGIVVDCIVSNNAAVRGGGGSGASYIRTRIVGNKATSGLGSGLYLGCDMYSCVFDDNTGSIGFYHAGNKSIIRNSIFGPHGASVRADGDSATKWCEAYNTVFMGPTIDNAGHIGLTNCVMLTTSKTAPTGIDADQDTLVVTGVSSVSAMYDLLDLDENLKPLDRCTSMLIDRGKDEYYVVPVGERAVFDIDGLARVVGGSIDLGPYEAPHARTSVLYVDAVNGNDGNSGGSADAPKKTLAATFSKAPIPGTTVRVAPGRYETGEMVASGDESTTYGEQKSRVVVPDGVTLESAEGAATTFIVGEPSETPPAEDCLGCGPGAVRCVRLLGNDGTSTATVRGFTIVGGRTCCNSRTAGIYGGGVYGYGIVEDCVFEDCVAERGGGVSRATCRRCTFTNCRATNMGSAAMSCEGVYNCIFDECTNDGSGSYITMYTRPVVNCTFMPGSQENMTAVTYGVGEDAPSNVVNCAIFTYSRGAQDYTHCAFTSGRKVSDANLGEGAVILDIGRDVSRADAFAAAGMGADGVLTTRSALVDAGTNGLYFASIGAKDASGEQRVYNRKIDIGACEYDWRGDFARALKRAKGLTVSEAGENVSTNAAGGVELRDGDALTAIWTNATEDATDYSFTVEVAGAGTLTYSVNGGDPVAVTFADGEKTVSVSGVESALSLAFSFAGDGSAVVSGLKRQGGGLVLLFR